MRVVIVGNGPAGVSAARRARATDASARITLISAESDEPFSRPALMYVYLGHLRAEHTRPYEASFWAANRIDRVRGWVDGIDLEARTARVDGRRTLSWDRLILATGSVANRLGVPGEHLDRVGPLVSWQDLEALEAWTPRVARSVVVGGGLIGVELAEMLHGRGRAVTMLVREPAYGASLLGPEEADVVAEVIRGAGVDLRLGVEVAAIDDDGHGGVGAVVTRDGARVAADHVGVAIGVRPNVAVVAGTPIGVARGIRVDDRLRTSVPGVFAAGDCAEIADGPGPGRVESVWYTARAQGEVVADNALGSDRAYQPGIWFNSAKFFDVEFQVYGRVPTVAAPDPDVESVLWRDGHRTVRLAHRGGVFEGVAALGVRLRHRVCERWIAEHTRIGDVVARFGEACFDPEFSRDVTPGLRAVAARSLGGARVG